MADSSSNLGDSHHILADARASSLSSGHESLQARTGAAFSLGEEALLIEEEFDDFAVLIAVDEECACHPSHEESRRGVD